MKPLATHGFQFSEASILILISDQCGRNWSMGLSFGFVCPYDVSYVALFFLWQMEFHPRETVVGQLTPFVFFLCGLCTANCCSVRAFSVIKNTKQRNLRCAACLMRPDGKLERNPNYTGLARTPAWRRCFGAHAPRQGALRESRVCSQALWRTSKWRDDSPVQVLI